MLPEGPNCHFFGTAIAAGTISILNRFSLGNPYAPTFEAWLDSVGGSGTVQIWGSVAGVVWVLIGTMTLAGVNGGDWVTPKVPLGFNQYKAVVPAGGISTGATITVVMGG